MAVATSTADFTDTSCSWELPPNRIATLGLFIRSAPVEIQAIEDRVRNDVVQNPLGVISRVRRDDYVGQCLQTQQKFVADYTVRAVEIEDTFVALQNIQRGTTQSSVFQGTDQRSG